jgi:arginyl-tRNA synthetase
MVNFVRNGEVVKMSKRKGTTVSLDSVVEEISSQGISKPDAIDVLKFFLLSKKPDTVTNFDFAELTQQSSDNPVFYVHYAYARSCSVIRNILSPIIKNNYKNITNIDEFINQFIINKNSQNKEIAEDVVDKIFKYIQNKPTKLSSGQRKIMLKILNYQSVLEISCQKYQPHLLINYGIELASSLHKAWNNNGDLGIKFICCEISDLNALNLSELDNLKSSVNETLTNLFILYFVNHYLSLVFKIFDIRSKLTM